MLDTASPALGGLRRAVRVAHERLRNRLEALVHSDVASALQEPIVTLRNGRYVVPVKAEARSRVKGIVHDQSGSGQTVFVEPLIAVELSNAWREAELAAQAEEERVLDELSAHVAADAEALEANLDALARFDLWMCRARLAEELDAVRPDARLASSVCRCCRRATQASRATSCPSTCTSATATPRSSSPAPTPAARPWPCAPWACWP